ncbi:hypothetical protein BCR34DRAFT_646411 [Clohesyomyces aquaticus]|uniref:Uncharacterized protein n=1 Tax=Clohesyomyces aquaticus TaxID=1231657 RepID=A0A1Y1ZW02_9PLEO|nr:hypothetical protein BCR34DRAFT_646411 [Clohesyomyces aquaticus]
MRSPHYHYHRHPPVTILNLNTTASVPDPLGIARVNGFYGPGTWASWQLAIATSWYNIFWNPNSRNVYDLIPYLLMTNWAAIDLIRQYTHRHETPGSEAFGRIAAAFNLTSWGLANVVIQFTVCLIQSDIQSQAESRAQRTSAFRHVRTGAGRGRPLKFIILGTGAFMPSAAITFISPSLFKDGTFGDTLPALYWKDISSPVHWFALATASTLGVYCLTSLFFLCLAHAVHFYETFQTPYLTSPHTLISRFEAMSMRTDRALKIGALCGCCATILFFNILLKSWRVWGDNWVLVIVVWPVTMFWLWFCFCAHWVAIFSTPFLALIFASKAVLSGFKIVPGSCFMMPCAPQSISEWDQAFALFLGLVMFLYETGPAWRRVRRARWRRALRSSERHSEVLNAA